MRGWRTALRLARREARRARGRSALVIAMIMLPMAALAYLAVQYDTFTLTPEERATQTMGTAQATMSWPAQAAVRQLPNSLRSFPTGPPQASPASPAEPSEARLLELLPAGSRVTRTESGSMTVHTATGIGSIRARMLDYSDPLAQGIYNQLSGRAPRGPDEVALTPAAATRLGTDVGGTMRLADGGRTYRVTALVEEAHNLETTAILVPPRAERLATDPGEVVWLAGTPGPVTWAQVKQLNTRGVVVLSRHVVANPPPASELYPLGVRIESSDPPAGVLTLIGGLAILEIVLLAGPAFAVGARRRQRDLALVAATGATPAQVRRIVLADGVVLGAVAAVVGAALGIAAAVATRPLVETYVGHRSGALRVYPLAQVVLIGLAVLTGVLAALVPAWISARQDVVTALAGRRGITRSRRRWPIAGLVLAAAGAALAVVGANSLELVIVLIGLVCFELGLVLCTPALVGLVARIGRVLPVAPRIALRDTSRNRTAAAPAISAVMAAVVGSLAIAVVIVAENHRAENAFSGRQGEVAVLATGKGSGVERAVSTETESALRTMMPVDQVHVVSELQCEGRHCLVRPQRPEAIDCPYRPLRLGRGPNEEEQRAARRDARCDDIGREHVYFAGTVGSTEGMTVVIDPAAAGAVAYLPAEDAELAAAALRSGKVVVDDPRYVDNGQVRMLVDVIGGDPGRGQPRTLTAPAFVLPHRPEAPIVMMTAPTAESLGFSHRPFVTFATTTRVPSVAEQDRVRAALGDDFTVEVARGEGAATEPLMILAIAAGVIALGAAALATGLAAADGRADLGTLAAVGASPRLRRGLSLSQTGVIAGLGSLLGAVAGLGASTAVLFALNQRFHDVWPAPLTYPISVPWLNLAIAVVVVPGVAMLGAGLLTRSRLPVERRRG